MGFQGDLLTIHCRMAEIAFGLICSCLVVLPRLYQHLTSVKPYPGASGTTLNADGVTRAQSQNNPANSKRQWVQLSDVKAVTKDERAMSDAVDDGHDSPV